MSRLAEAARAYVGVTFRHRGRGTTRLDCVGLGILAYRDCGVELPDVRRYGRMPTGDTLREALEAALGPAVAEGVPTPGDVVVFDFGDGWQHVAIVALNGYGQQSLIHADSRVGQVVEHRFSDDWRKRVVAVYRRGV